MLKKAIGIFGIYSILLQPIYGMEKENKVDITLDHSRVKSILADNTNLLSSSRDRDIVVFLGSTGSGKSTVINYITDKNLMADRCKIILEDSTDKSAMAIGMNDISMTSLPKSIQANDLLLYDLPGFGDTRGTIESLLNACFIKNIIENAKSSKLIFIAGMDQVTSERGKALRELLTKVGQFIPNQAIETFSSLIITKSDQYRDDLTGFLKDTMQAHPIPTLEFWMSNQKVDQMSKPDKTQTGKKIDDSEKENILELIKRTGSKEIKKVDVELIFDFKEINTIKELYVKEMKDIFCNMKFIKFSLEEDMESFNIIHDEEVAILERNINKLEGYKKYYTLSFMGELDSSLNDSELIKLLRPISQATYESTLSQMKEEFNSHIKMRISEVDKKIQLFNSDIKSVKVNKLERELKDKKEEIEIRKLEIQHDHEEKLQQQLFNHQLRQKELEIQEKQLEIHQQQINGKNNVEYAYSAAKVAIEFMPIVTSLFNK